MTLLRKTRRIGPYRGLGTVRGQEPLPLSARGPDVADPTDPKIAYFEQSVSPAVARACYALLRQGIQGTLPELVVYQWLTRRGYQFDFQTSLMGGRLELGGAVADFVIFDLDPGGIAVWRVQGEHWHAGNRDKEEKDRAQRETLLRQSYMGQPVTVVIDLWEQDLYDHYPRVLEMAEAGVEMRPT